MLSSRYFLKPTPPPWFFSAIYTNPSFNTRQLLWEELKIIAQTHKGKWLMRGDFNEVLLAKEKLGGLSISNTRTSLFKDYLDNCGMLDLGFKGCKYTWTNKRYKHKNSLILERLDRCVANTSWINQYPEASVSHLPRTKSDHCLMLLTLTNSLHAP